MYKHVKRIVKEDEKKVEKLHCVIHKDRECSMDYAHCITLYPECEYNMENKVDSKEETSVKKTTLKWNKADIKCTVTGKFKIEVYPVMIDVDKMESYALAMANVSKDKLDVSLNDHKLDHIRDLDGIAKWNFMFKFGEDVHCDLMQHIIRSFDDIVWCCNFATETEFQKVRNSLTKSVNKAIQKGNFSFRKLEDIVYGHQDIDENLKELVEQNIIMEAEEYLNTFEDLRENVVINTDSTDDATDIIRSEMRREDKEEAEDKVVSREEEAREINEYLEEEENKYEDD